MSTKSNQTPKRKHSKANKKIKRDKENSKNLDRDDGTTKTSIIPQSPSNSEQQAHHQTDDQQDEGKEDTNHHDESTNQSFAERLKILNLQSDASDRLVDPNESELGSKDGQTEQEEGLSRKILKAQKHSKTNVQASTNQSNSINDSFPIIPIASIGSFAQTLTQALKSTDTKLLESCFLQYESKKNKDLIATTIQRLPKTLLHNLIQQLVICLNRRKRGHGDGLTVAPVKRTKALIEWVRQILIVHMSYLLTIPSLVTQLTTLHASLQKRLSLHTKLLALNGRLDLVLNQMELKKITTERNNQIKAASSRPLNGINPKKTNSSSVSKNEPFKYIEGQSSESEAQEDGQGKSRGDKGSRSNSSHDEDEDTSDEEKENGDGMDVESNHSDEGSVEEVVLRGSGSSDENSGESDGSESGEKLGHRFDDLLDLEAVESNSELGDHDDDDDEEDSDEDEDEDEEDDSMDGFIDDGTQEEDDTDSE